MAVPGPRPRNSTLRLFDLHRPRRRLSSRRADLQPQREERLPKYLPWVEVRTLTIFTPTSAASTNCISSYAKGPVFFRVGRQAISWGESDTVAMLDQNNPFDLTLAAPGDLRGSGGGAHPVLDRADERDLVRYARTVVEWLRRGILGARRPRRQHGNFAAIVTAQARIGSRVRTRRPSAAVPARSSRRNLFSSITFPQEALRGVAVTVSARRPS